jgi:hypothetical protein
MNFVAFLTIQGELEIGFGILFAVSSDVRGKCQIGT